MPSYNRVLLMGNLTRDPEQRFTASGAAVCDFTLASSRKFQVNGQEREETLFADVQVWGKTAETVAKYCGKGYCLFVEGRLILESWQDRRTGEKRQKMRVAAERVQFIGGGSQSRDNQGVNVRTVQPDSGSNAGQPHRYSRQDAQPPADSRAHVPASQTETPPEMPHEDDIPF